MSPHDYECIEPTLGAKLDLLGWDELDPDLQERLRQHLRICHACRERTAFAGLAGEMIAAGLVTDTPTAGADLQAGEPESPADHGGVIDARTRFAGSALRRGWLVAGVAACIAFILALLLPPAQGFRGDFLRRAADDDFAFKRPLEGEALPARGGCLVWSEVGGAESYHVTVESADGTFRWSGDTATPSLDLPPGSEARGFYIAAVKTRPADLLPGGEGSVSFNRQGTRAWLVFRLANPSLFSLAFLLLAVAQSVFALTRRK